MFCKKYLNIDTFLGKEFFDFFAFLGELIENKTRSAIRRILRQELGKEPIILVHIEQLG